MTEKAILILGDRRHELPVLTGTEGERALDISKLREQTGLIAYDPSLGNTALCRSEITFTDGERGILRYRGIPIEQFADKPDFVEAAWLLIFGRLPRREELAKFSGLMTANELLHEGVRHQFQHVPPDAPPMALLSATLSNLACYHQEFFSLGDEESLEEAATRLISKVRTIAAFSHRRSLGMPFIYPDPKLRYCANFLHMMFSIPYRQYHISQEVEDALNLIFILHADHELNCSTSTVRIVGSAGANLFASCAAGVCALWGSLHGGANVEVMEMLERISRGGLSPEECIRAAKDKTNPFRLHGFGHRVYRRYDPRAKILKAACERVFAGMERKDPLLDIARKLEELALADPYFVDRNLYPNVDFYSGILLRAIGIPTNMFTVCFAIGRLPGWIAHWKEQHDDPNTKIQRPRQIYTGPNELTYVPMEKR
ncbi:MAG: citrate synthase [Planctomycetes bacterium]|nr:citrate synthase [Planctomycetota bacterium]MBU4399457.1 citrate synthase [Planctomycetota bacterium]MCG2683097.1 citrate synthase [Planctomycetales bacterium]